LSALDSEVAEQLREGIEAARNSLQERARSDGETLGERLGHLGMLYQTYDLALASQSAYRCAEALDPSAFEWAYLQGVVLEMSGQGREATTAFERALTIEPTDVPTLVRAADGLLDQQELDSARAYYRRALDEDSRSVVALWGLGRVELREGRTESAVDYLTRGLAIEPQATRLHATLAEAYRRNGDLQRAQEQVSLQGMVDPTLADPRLEAVTRLRRGVGSHMARGFQAASSGRWEEAVDAYRAAVEASPESPEARRGFADALSRLGRTTESVEQYRVALELEPQSGIAHYNVASVLPGEASIEALALLERAVALAPEVPEFEIARLGRLVTLGRLDDAESGYRQILTSDPSSIAAASGLAQLATERGELDGALEIYNALLERDLPERVQAELYFSRGRLWSVARSGDLGQSDFEQAVRLVPLYLEARFALANTYGILGRFSDAASAYREVLETEPGHVGARLGEVTALALDGQLKEARESVARGLALSPDHPDLMSAARQLEEGVVQ